MLYWYLTGSILIACLGVTNFIALLPAEPCSQGLSSSRPSFVAGRETLGARLVAEMAACFSLCTTRLLNLVQ